MTVLEAVAEQDLISLGPMLAAGLDPEGDDPTTSPLLQALFQKSEEMVRLLLDAGADPNRAPADLSPLMVATGETLTRLLVKAGARVPLESGIDMTGYPGFSLHDAAEDGDAPRLRVLLEEADGRTKIESYDVFGHTPLGAAAQAGKATTLRLLLEHGADPNGCDPDHFAYTPLKVAAGRSRAAECVRLLLEYGADPDHAWPNCGSGRATILCEGDEEMRRLLAEADRHPERRRLTSESVRRRLMEQVRCWGVVSPELRRLGGNHVWVFGSLDGPSLAWNWKWGVVRDGKVRWHPAFQGARSKLGSAGIPGVCEHHGSQT